MTVTQTAGQLVAQPLQPLIRPVLLEDVDAVLELHAIAFAEKFRAAFSHSQREAGVRALASAYRIQGLRGLVGMYVAERDGQIIGTISLRTRDMASYDLPPIERALYEHLGSWGAFRAMFAFSQLEHTIAPDEGFVTDVAVHADYRRQGIAKLLLDYVTERALARQKRYLGLYVGKSNEPARALYRSIGFADQKVHRSLWNRWLLGELSWVYMRKQLTLLKP